MARPRKTGLDYFPHDVDVTTDPKLEPAILRYGAAAYAFYFVHLEYCYRSDDLSVDISATETGQEMREVIQRKLHISAEDYEGILRSFLRHGAFDSEFYEQTGRLTSNGIKKRAGKVFEKRDREAARYKNAVSESVYAAETTPETTQTAAEIYTETRQSIAKKSIAEKRIEDVSPSPDSEESAAQKPTTQEIRFNTFWETYPKKVGKQAALKSWNRIKPNTELYDRIMAAVEVAKKSEQWQRENKRFIPNPATWLNQGRWDDEPPEAGPSASKHGNTVATPAQIIAEEDGPEKLHGFHMAEE